MPENDPRVDDYIARSALFAQPILIHLRRIVHMACPDAKETMKWSFPHFDYKGSILCDFAAFKQHAVFGFWLSSQMSDPDNILSVGDDRSSMGHFGQLKEIKDLPADKIMIKYIRHAMSLIDSGVKLKKKVQPVKESEIVIPESFVKALEKNKKASAVFSKFSPSARKEYYEWITEAKTETTRAKRTMTALQWIEEGKQRNWKYQ